ncbi:amidohydrolase [Variovorax sp. Sphag1AA]|uniref:amidohydrolase family protein n=1 Tax=Variovorax sp. Sphag1AA TaxID=2587027 RepID=UPI00160EBF1E|nr:amidohydrolase family protein [Variovorax sp. Sphag1AA]MBB3181043.1 putative TIM-barrel fold metal-dependent hydrolase [Variovorax sp. Sphag1AA]
MANESRSSATPQATSLFTATRAPDHAWLDRVPAEAPIEPELAIVDPHMHLWDHKTGYRYFVPEFARDVAASGHTIDATVFIECHAMYRATGPEHLRWVGETEFAVGMAAMAASGKYTNCQAAAAIVGYADLTLGDRTRATLEAHVEAANGRFRGVRQRGKWDPDPAVNGPVGADRTGVYLEKEFGEGIDLLTSMGLSFDASVFHTQLSQVTALARAHPDATIVLVHTGSPLGHSSYVGREAEVHANWLAGMKELATCPNVSVKLGGLLMCLGNFDFSTAEIPPTSEQLERLWRPYLEPCLELFGAERCMASSNFPVEKAGMPYGTVWNMFKRLIAGCSLEEKKLILGGTARRIYRLP